MKRSMLGAKSASDSARVTLPACAHDRKALTRLEHVAMATMAA